MAGKPLRRVQVGAVSYEVTWDEHSILKASRELRSDLYGRTDVRNARINLNPDQDPQQARDTLLHEVLHAIFAMTGLTVSVEDDDEERIIRTLTPLLLDVLRRNPKLVRFLMED